MNEWVRDAIWLVACVGWYWSGRLTGRRKAEMEYVERARWFREASCCSSGSGVMAENNARDQAESAELCARPWRQGRKVPRNVYAHDGEEGVAIGTFDSEWLAEAAVVAHNRTHGFPSNGGTTESGR